MTSRGSRERPGEGLLKGLRRPFKGGPGRGRGADPRTAGLWTRGCLACQSSVQAVLWRMSVLSSPSARRLPSLPEFRASGSLAGDGAFLRSCEEGYLAFRSSVQAVLWRATVLSSVAGPGAPRGVVAAVAAVAAVAGCPSGCLLATECCVCACLIKLAQSGSTQPVAQRKNKDPFLKKEECLFGGMGT